MDKFLEKLHKFSASVHFSHDRKTALKARLETAMDQPALKIEPASAHIFRRFFVPALSFVALLLVAGGGTSIAAEYALPGDPLYPVKIKFNEPLVGLLNAAPPLRAAWQVRVVERRLEEADKLALQGKLDTAARAQLTAGFTTAAAKAQTDIAGLTNQGDAQEAVDVSARMEASLKAHAAILGKFDTAEKNKSDSLENKITTVLSQAVAVRHDAENKVAAAPENAETDTAAQSKIGVATSIIASVRNYLDAQSSVLGAEAMNNADTRLRSAQDLLNAAVDSQNNNDYGQAFILAGKAIRRAQETQVLASAQVDANQSAVTIAAAPAVESTSTATSTASSTETGISIPASLNFLAGGDISTSSDDTVATSTDQNATSTATSTISGDPAATSTQKDQSGGGNKQ